MLYRVVRNIKYKQKYKNLFIDDVCHTSLYVCVCIGVRREERRRVKEEKVKKVHEVTLGGTRSTILKIYFSVSQNYKIH